jgi:hypothetical protein
MYMGGRMAWHNPMSQVWLIQAQYWSGMTEMVLLICLGIMYAKKKNAPMHMVRMVFAFLQSVFGSGAIRVTAWILWLLSKFFP